MPTYIACTRVSTTRQIQGVSLFEQCAAIERYAAARGLHIIQWFEQVSKATDRQQVVGGTRTQRKPNSFSLADAEVSFAGEGLSGSFALSTPFHPCLFDRSSHS